MSENVLELKNITMKFGGVTALNEVNLVVKKGEILALIGPNGAGKTTVFNVITGVYKPTSGDVLFHGESIVGKKRHLITKLGIARTFQNIRLFGESTALENVVTGADVHSKTGVIGSIFGTPRSRREEKAALDRALELLEFMGIKKRAGQLERTFRTEINVVWKSHELLQQTQNFFFWMSLQLDSTRQKRLPWLKQSKRFVMLGTQFCLSSTICH